MKYQPCKCMNLHTPPLLIPTFLFLALTFLLSAGCGTVKVYKAVVSSNSPSRNEVTKTDALRTFLKNNPQPKIVLRVPTTTHDVTASEQDKLTRYYNLIEREFLKNNYTVRDRGLLTQLLKGGHLSYSEIAKQIDTDLIIEILDLDLCNDYNVSDFNIPDRDNESRKLTAFYGLKNINCVYGKLEVRVTIVESGELGGIIKTHYSSCDGGRTFYIRVHEKEDGTLNLLATGEKKRPRVGWKANKVTYSRLLSNWICVDEKGQERNIQRLTQGLIKELK